MTAPTESISIAADPLEPFEDRVDILFRELELATKWERPSVLLAIYSSEYVRSDADVALENRLHKLGQSTYHIKIKNEDNADVTLLISELANTSNVVFFVEGLRWGAGRQDCCAYRTLNKSREFFIENRVRVVFWLTENEAINLAHHAPDYWSFRHRVIEFVDSPSPEQITPHILESAWQGSSELAEPADDLDARIALREALLEDLPDGNESTSARANLLLTLGILHWRRGDFEKAGRFLNKALDLAATLEDESFEALCFNAIALVESDLGRVDQAIQAFQNAISLAPDTVSAWNALGNLYKKAGRNEDALEAFQKALEQNAGDAIGWNGLGGLYLKLGRNDEAIYAFLKAIEFSPNYHSSWSGLGNAYKDEGQLEDALAAYKKAIELNRRDVHAWLGLGEIQQLQGQNENSALAFRTALELEPRNAHAWNAIGDLHYHLGAFDEALNGYQQAIEIDPDCNPSYSNLASIHVQQGRHAEAIPLLQKAIELADDTTDLVCLWNRLGDAQRRLDNYDDAIAAYRTADALDKESASRQETTDNAVPDGIPTSEDVTGIGETEPQSLEFIKEADENFYEPAGLGDLAVDPGPDSSEETEPESLEVTKDTYESPADAASPEDILVHIKIATSKETPGPEPIEPELVPDNNNAAEANDYIPTISEVGFMDWLDGLASVLPVAGAVDEPTLPVELPRMPQAASHESEATNLAAPLEEDGYEPFPVVADLPDNEDGLAVVQMPASANQALERLKALKKADRAARQAEQELPAQADPVDLEVPTYLRRHPEQTDPGIGIGIAPIWNELGNKYLKTEAYEEAAQAFQKAIELDKTSPDSYNDLAALYFRQGRFEDAIHLYENGLEFLQDARDKATFWNRLGDAYRRLDQVDQAGKAYRKAMELDPANVSLLTRARFSLLGNCQA